MRYLLIFAFIGVAFATQELAEKKRFRLNEQTAKKLAFRVQSFKGQQRDLVVINDLVDQIVTEIAVFLLQNDYDPYQMPDMHFGFEYKPIIITYHGELDLTRGWLQDMSTLLRNGNATLSEQNSFVIIKLPIAFNNLIVNYLYSAKIMSLGPVGSVYGKIYDVKAQIDILIDLLSLEAMLMDVHVEAGELNLEFHGNGLVDWLVNIFVDITTNILHDRILHTAESIIEGITRDLIDQINEIIGGILGRHGPPKDVPIHRPVGPVKLQPLI